MLTCSLDLSEQLIAESIEANMECLSCGAHEHARTFIAREFLFGTNEAFPYTECARCGSLQIAHIPPNLDKFYPSDYYSMVETGVPIEQLGNLRRFVRSARADYHIGRKNLLGWMIDKLAPNYSKINWEWFTGYASITSRILDVGCGSGGLLREMRAQGFRNLTGIDPFVAHPLSNEGFRIVCGELVDLDERFDFVMLHHSLEHMPEPLEALREVRRLVASNGVALIRCPIAGTFAAEHYGINWAGLDPPRHLFVPSLTGIKELTRRAGLSVCRFWFDTSEWYLLLSEAIARGLPPYDRDKGIFNVANLFTASEFACAREQAADLNRRQEGDKACFILMASN